MYSIFILILILFSGCRMAQYTNVTKTDRNGFTFETTKNDPTDLRTYKLKNGLTVYLSKNTESPNIQTFIAVKTGSNNDPDDNTGLAHYLEHMMFKGTSKIGTKNWTEEKKLLNQIKDLYEQHKQAKNDDERKNIYQQIDSTSKEASKHAIANEYDKIIGEIGGKGTNAHTWFEETVYRNVIPSNQLEKWLKLERERFGELTLRLFHTELETVYEEFNRGEDNDQSRAIDKLFQGLFPTHPYGTKTTIGKAEHLRTPSMKAIHEYFDKYYVPNNMAIVLSGDLDYEESILLIDQYFGTLKEKPFEQSIFPEEKPITQPIIKEVFGPMPDMLFFAFRTGGIHTKDRLLGEMFADLMSNSQAGILDINLNQAQKVLESGAGNFSIKDYSMVYFYGMPLEDQTLEDVFNLIYRQINEIKEGRIDDKLVAGAKNKMYKQAQTSLEGNGRANFYYQSFINELSWKEQLEFIQNLQNINKDDVIDFANRVFNDNYVLIYKRQGTPKDVAKIEKPQITPITLDRNSESDFAKGLDSLKTKDIDPKFIDFNKEISKNSINGVSFSFIENKTTDLFSLNVIWDIGSRHFKELSVGSELLDLANTDSRQAQEVALDLFSLGASYKLTIRPKETTLTVSGIDSYLTESWDIVYNLFQQAQVDSTKYQAFVEKVAKVRADEKKNKDQIKRALKYFALYGEDSDFRHIYPIKTLKEKQASDFLSVIRNLFDYPHKYFYYGSKRKEAANLIKKTEDQETYKPLPQISLKVTHQKPNSKVYFVDYEMIQSEIFFYNNTVNFDETLLPVASLFNSYFGSGLSSIVFQEIRESKALAYSAYSFFKPPRYKQDPFRLTTYLGTQADKLPEAIEAIHRLLSEIPLSETQFSSAKTSEISNIKTSRLSKSLPFWKQRDYKKLGLEGDYRKVIYEALQKISLEDVKDFFDKYIKGKSFTYCVIGKKENIDFKVLEKLGSVEELNVDFLFNDQN